ncbi:ATP-binding protein [Marinilabilia salmonicolor]|uniref:Serine/threonine-protein kinase RsbW n=1 Tax=Marinilabilia salmonicolor TaxID=989 RepID=A0A368UYZ1_9BACT|nr:ATP-binding protein [Marinilabilia salmonicolor]RCW32011.1 serine/threonine-protein kinase RsbW [Marinilabilia salmonicolor]
MVFKSEIKNINLVERLIDDISAKYQLHSDIYGKLLLAVVEGVNNAIVHGNKLESDKDVVLQYEITDKIIQFVITDNGSGFNYKDLPDPTKPENLEKTHGRGIFLMNHLADEVEFNEKGNEVKVIFNLS